MTAVARRQVAVSVGAWYGDHVMALDMPAAWDVNVVAPATPAPIDDAQIRFAVENLVGQPPLRQAARAKRRPLIIVDDLTRPTPTGAVVPHLLRELNAAGIPSKDVRIMVASGAHGLPAKDAAAKKAGREAAAECRLLVHDARTPGVRLGRTSFGTPVIVDREVAASDLVIGVGGVYPQHSVGFGGGSKLVLGILSQRSIVGLHYGHPSVAGSYDTDNDFRRDLDEMARMAGLRTVVTVHVDAARKPVRVVAGDPELFYQAAAQFSMACYQAELPGERFDVVIANAYPMDVSLTFARSKGLAPLAHAGPHASRVLIAACPEGLGLHRLFPYLNGPRFEAHIHRLRRWSVVRPSTIPGRASRKARAAFGKLQRRRAAAPAPEHPHQQYAGQVASVERQPIHLWAPMAPANSLPQVIPGFRRASEWIDVVNRIAAEHSSRERLRVGIYPCAPLQCLQTAAVREPVRSRAS